MNVGIQISSFKPLMTDEAGLESVLCFLHEIGCAYTCLQWIDKTIPPQTVAALLEKYGIAAAGVQEKTALLLQDEVYYLDLCRLCGGSDLCFSGVPNADVHSLLDRIDALESKAVAYGIHLSYHPVSADLPGAYRELLEQRPRLRLTLDVCQLHDAGLDPSAFICRSAGRVDTVHFKDRRLSGELCPVGEGTIDFASALNACIEAGVKLILTEQESWKNAFAELKAGYIRTQSLLKRLNI